MGSPRGTEQFWSSLLDEVVAGFALHEMLFDAHGRPRDYRFTMVSPGFERIMGLKAHDMVGRVISEMFPGAAGDWVDTYASVVLTGEPLKTRHYSESLDRHYEVTAHRPAPGHFACSFIDVTSYVKAEVGTATGAVKAFRDESTELKFWKREGEALEQRILGLTKPLDDGDVAFEDLFVLSEIQRIQDEFALATGVASIITKPDGTPITQPSQFTRLCGSIIRQTEVGCYSCHRSDASIGRHHAGGPVAQTCLSGGLWDAGAAIMVGERHIANWLIGQVRNEAQTEEGMLEYARRIGADERDFIEAFREVPSMPYHQFQNVAQALFTLSSQLSTSAYQNVQQARFIFELKQVEAVLRESEERFRVLSNSAQDAIVMMDPEGRVSYWNPSSERIFGYTSSEALGKGLHELLASPDDAKAYHGASPGFRRTGRGPAIGRVTDVKARRKEGREIDVQLALSAVGLGDGWHAVAIVRDVSERKAAERQATLQQERLALALEASSDSIWDSNWLTGEAHVSPRQYEMLGYEPGEFASTNAAWLALVHPDDVRRVVDACDACRWVGTDDEYRVEVRRRAKDGTWRWILSRARVVERSPSGSAVRVIGVNTDMTERRLKEEELGFVSSHDTLTGLANRRYVEGYLTAEAVMARVPTTLIMGDVNGLKLINDTFGHEEGDRLLVAIGGLLRDVVGCMGTVARWGGDEFLVVLPGVDGPAALELAHRMRGAFAAFPRDPFPLSVALGAATRLATGESVQDTMRDAEERMYHSKLMEGKSARSSIISALRETLSAKTFETDEHCRRMQLMAAEVSEYMGLADSVRDDVLLLSLLHDIGKIGVPEAILAKPGRLTPEERVSIERHAEIGFRIAKASYELTHIAEGILSHHEWWNGAGYPQGLAGQAIPLIARIIGVVDAYDAMTSDRSYRAALTDSEALQELRRCSGTQFDPEIVAAVTATASFPRRYSASGVV